MKESIKVNWIFNLAVSLFVAIITSITTAHFQSKYTLKNWQIERAYEMKYDIGVMRLDLIKKLSELVGRTPGINDLWILYLQNSNISERNAKQEIVVKDLNLSEKLANFNGEYSATLIQAGLLFGPKTKLAIDDFQKEGGPFWTRDTDMALKIIAAMNSEGQYFEE